MGKILPMVRQSYEYTALADYNLKWNDPKQLQKFRKLWRKGFDLGFMARELDRHPIEIMCLVMDQAEKGYIDQREGGIWGNRGQR